MKFICYSCECGCSFAIDNFSDDGGPCCPRCGNESTVDGTGECMNDPEIVFDRDRE